MAENGDELLTTKRKMNGLHKGPLELYLIRISPSCRSVWQYLLQHEIPHLLIDVDFSRNPENLPLVFRTQPHQEVPILVDGDVVIFEGQAILRYLAMRYTGNAGFGLTLKQQMACESLVSWSFGELHRSIGYNYIYPQFLENYSYSPESANDVVIEKGLRQVTHHLEVLEKQYLEKNKYLTGTHMTIADSCVASVIVLLEWTGFNFKMWPKVDVWLNRVKQQPFWDEVHKTHQDFVGELQRSSLLHS